MSDASDLIELNEAAEVSGRSKSTLRVWIRSGKLKDLRGNDAGQKAPVKVSRSALLQLCAAKSQGPRKVQPAESAGPGAQAMLDSIVEAYKEKSATLQDSLEDARAERDDWKVRCENAERVHEKLLVDLSDARRKVAVLEGELNQGFRGLLVDRARRTIFGR
jgi:hypothetical protein